jgi:hypothetical protein
VVVGIFSFSVLAANAVYLPVSLWKAYQRKQARAKLREMIRRELDSAPKEELAVLSYLLSSGRRAFAAEFNDRRLVPLVSKGILTRMGGTHSMLEWPYVVQEDVWEYLQENRARFFVPELADKKDPFNWRSGW